MTEWTHLPTLHASHQFNNPSHTHCQVPQNSDLRYPMGYCHILDHHTDSKPDMTINTITKYASRMSPAFVAAWCMNTTWINNTSFREQISPINQYMYNYNGKQTQANASANMTNDSKPTSITSTHTHMNHYCSHQSSYIASLIIGNLD